MIAIKRTSQDDINFPFITTIIIPGDEWNKALEILMPLVGMDCIEEVKKLTHESVEYGCINLLEPLSFNVSDKLKEAGFDVRVSYTSIDPRCVY